MKRIALAIAVAASLTACTSFDKETETKGKSDAVLGKVERKLSPKPYQEVDMPFSDKRPVSLEQQNIEWLREIQVELKRNTTDANGIELRALLDMLNAQGLRVTSTLPTHRMHYKGFGLPEGTDAYTALKIITEQMGADFVVESGANHQPYVSIVEMGSEMYRLNVPDIKTALTVMNNALGQESQSGQQGGSGGMEGGSGGGMSGGMIGGQGGGMSPGGQGGQQNGQGGAGSNSYAFYETRFWETIEEQLEDMLKVAIPARSQSSSEMNNSMPTEMRVNGRLVDPRQAAAGDNSIAGGSLYEVINVGNVSVNPTTGYINVVAPKHIRNRIGDYLDELNTLINTRLSVKAEIVSVTTSRDESRGINMGGFKRFFEGEYGVTMSNQILGNIDSSNGGGYFSAVADGALSPTLLGIEKTEGMFSAFSAYLEQFGDAQSVTELSGSSRSGQTLQLKRTNRIPRIETRISNIASEGGTTSNSETETIYDTTGTFVSVTPSYDHAKGMINSLINIQLILDAGTVTEESPIVSNGTIEIRTVQRTAFDEVQISTDAPSRAGEMIVVGGYEISNADTDQSGVTELHESPLGGLLGQSSQSEEVTKLYVLLTVTPTHPYDNVFN